MERLDEEMFGLRSLLTDTEQFNPYQMTSSPESKYSNFSRLY